MRSGSRPSPDGTRLLFAGDTVSPMMCPADGQQEKDKKRPDEHIQDEGRDTAEKNKSRPRRGGGFSLNLDLCLVFRGGLVCVISQDISRYIVTSCPISCEYR